MVVKLLGLGFKYYFIDRYNIVDFAVVIVNSIDIALNTYY